MELTTKSESGVCFVTVTGRLDAVAAPDFDRQFTTLIGGGETTFVIDMAGLDYISSAGLRSILAAAKQVKSTRGRLCLVSSHQP